MTRRMALLLMGLLVGVVAPGFAEDKKEEAKGWLGVQLRLDDVKGDIVIEVVMPDSPAEKGGLKNFDVVIEFNKEKVTALMDFVTKVGEKKPGEEITLKVKRCGEDKEIKVKLGERPKDLGK